MRCHTTAFAFAHAFPARTAALAGALALAGARAQAAVFVVDTAGDDGSAAFQVCADAVPGDCSLRGALARANANSDADEIHFAIPDTDPGYVAATAHWRIALASGLPYVQNGPLIIDGFTQPGAAPSTHAPGQPIAHTLKIELRGPGASSSSGQCFMAFTALTLRGLAINNCWQALYAFGGYAFTVEGNYIGTDVTGATAVPNGFGIMLGGDMTIGGATPAQANLFAANLGGALSQQQQVTRLRVQGNVFGTNAAMTQVLGRQDYALYLSGSYDDVIVGGATPEEGNAINGSTYSAIVLSDSGQTPAGAPRVRVIGNTFGVGAGGAALGNGLNPASPSQSQPTIIIGHLGDCRTQIGGDAPGEGNLIAHSGNAGVAVGSCWGAPILGNRFLANRGIPVDLAGSTNFDGPTANDANDVDGTPADPGSLYSGNRFQNKAEVISVVENLPADELRVTLKVDSAPANQAYPLRLDFYYSAPDGALTPGYSASYDEASAQQPAEFVLPLSVFRRSGGGGIVVTDADGNSSELQTAFDYIFCDGFEDEEHAEARGAT